MIFYAKHIHFLAFIHFEYGYNMKVNIGVGMYNLILPIMIWLVLCVTGNLQLKGSLPCCR